MSQQGGEGASPLSRQQWLQYLQRLCLTVARYRSRAANRWALPLEGGAAQARGQQQ